MPFCYSNMGKFIGLKQKNAIDLESSISSFYLKGTPLSNLFVKNNEIRLKKTLEKISDYRNKGKKYINLFLEITEV